MSEAFDAFEMMVDTVVSSGREEYEDWMHDAAGLVFDLMADDIDTSPDSDGVDLACLFERIMTWLDCMHAAAGASQRSVSPSDIDEAYARFDALASERGLECSAPPEKPLLAKSPILQEVAQRRAKMLEEIMSQSTPSPRDRAAAAGVLLSMLPASVEPTREFSGDELRKAIDALRREARERAEVIDDAPAGLLG